MTERRKNQSFTHFITVNKYQFCISVIGYINIQIINNGRSLLQMQQNKVLVWPDNPPTVSQLILLRKMLSKRAIFILHSNRTHTLYNLQFHTIHQKLVLLWSDLYKMSRSKTVLLLLVFLHQSLCPFTTVKQIPAYERCFINNTVASLS